MNDSVQIESSIESSSVYSFFIWKQNKEKAETLRLLKVIT